MIIVQGINIKKVNDPVFLSARKFMVERLARLEAAGPSKELDIARDRYTGLTAKDVIIEPPVSFNSGIVRCCFLSRKTGFFRADIEVEKVDPKLIFDEFLVDITTYSTVDELVLRVKGGVQGAGVVFITGLDKYGIVTTADKSTPEDAMKIMNDIYWDKIIVDTLDAMDPTTKSSGTFSVESINIDPLAGLLFVIEDLEAIA